MFCYCQEELLLLLKMFTCLFTQIASHSSELHGAAFSSGFPLLWRPHMFVDFYLIQRRGLGCWSSSVENSSITF